MENKSFIQLCVEGKESIENINKYIREYENKTHIQTIYEFLGMSCDEYKKYLTSLILKDTKKALQKIIDNHSNKKHLWEIEHDYYCDCSENHSEYKSLNDFLEYNDDLDLDLNLLFRWDWTEQDKLNLFFVRQRKSDIWSVEIEVKKEEEEKIKEYLKPRLNHLMRLWNPL